MPGFPPSRGAWVLLLAWLASMALLMGLVWWARQEVIASLSRPAAQAEWQRWKQEETARQADPRTPVRRRAPKSDEPPALVLMRDSFPAIAVALLVVGTLCFGFGVLTFRGIRKPRGSRKVLS